MCVCFGCWTLPLLEPRASRLFGPLVWNFLFATFAAKLQIYWLKQQCLSYKLKVGIFLCFQLVLICLVHFLPHSSVFTEMAFTWGMWQTLNLVATLYIRQRKKTKLGARLLSMVFCDWLPHPFGSFDGTLWFPDVGVASFLSLFAFQMNQI